MVKVEATENFTLEKFNELTNIVRKGVDTPEQKQQWDMLRQLNAGDVFECTEEMYDYLNGQNAKGKVVVKLLEIIPAKKEKPEKEEKPKAKPKATKKKTTKK